MGSEQFEPHFWHDCLIHGLRLGIGDPKADVWRSDLILDRDYIVSWPCISTGQGRLQIAPATLTFDDAGDLRILIDCGDTRGQVALSEFSIDRVTREPIKNQKVCLDRPYYFWRIELNWPKAGLICFAASGFTQLLHGDPVLSDTVRFPRTYRKPRSEANPCG
jgi:hypothetical protein